VSNSSSLSVKIMLLFGFSDCNSRIPYREVYKMCWCSVGLQCRSIGP
jgi:hypothetical protein